MPPSPDHEVLVELFRNCGQLAPELLQTCAHIVLDHDHVEVTSIDLSQVASTEYRADAVVELRDRDNTAVAGVIAEVQLNRDLDKEYSWPLYVAALRAKLRCPVTLFVLTPDPAVARWARRPIELGHPGFRLEPVVIELEEVPRSIDLAHARKLPELAVLSALAHPGLETAVTALSAIEGLPEDQKKLYLDLIMARLPHALRQMQELGMLKGYKYQSEFALQYYNQGHDNGRSQGREEGRSQGREEGRSQGREEGRSQGREEGLRAALLLLARNRLDAVTTEDEAAIMSLHEHALTELIGALGQASTASDARAAFDLAIRKLHGS